MWSNKPPFTLHRILEFGFRKLRQTIAKPIPQILELANYQRAFWAEQAVLSGIFRKALSALKEI